MGFGLCILSDKWSYNFSLFEKLLAIELLAFKYFKFDIKSLVDNSETSTYAFPCFFWFIRLKNIFFFPLVLILYLFYIVDNFVLQLLDLDAILIFFGFFPKLVLNFINLSVFLEFSFSFFLNNNPTIALFLYILKYLYICFDQIDSRLISFGSHKKGNSFFIKSWLRFSSYITRTFRQNIILFEKGLINLF